MFTPKLRQMIQFDLNIFFKWVGSILDLPRWHPGWRVLIRVKLLSLVFSGFSAAKKKTAPWIGHFIGESCKASKNWFCWRCLWRLMMNEVTLGTQWFKRLFIRHHEGARKLQSLHQDLQNSGKDQGSAVGIESSLSFCLSYWWFLG